MHLMALESKGNAQTLGHSDHRAAADCQFEANLIINLISDDYMLTENCPCFKRETDISDFIIIIMNYLPKVDLPTCG